MAQREGLEASHEDTVGNDEPHEDRELFAHLVHIGFEHLVYDDNQCRNHYQLYNDADAVGDGIAQQRDDDVGESDDGSHRYGHDECRFEFCRYGQAEQIPNICTITGLFLESGPKSISLFFFDNMAYIFFELSDSKNWA